MSKILLNSAFVGSYADNSENLSREVINFLRADNGKYYVYLSPYGSYPDCDDLEYILFVKNCGHGVVEILAKATVGNCEKLAQGIKTIRGQKTKIRENDNEKDKIKNYKERVKGITYGDKTHKEQK